MKSFRKPAPVQMELMQILLESPLPWATEMIRGWLGLTERRCTKLLLAMRTAGRIWNVEKGFYTAIEHYRETRENVQSPEATTYRTATFSPRGPSDVITDDMLKRYGYNL